MTSIETIAEQPIMWITAEDLRWATKVAEQLQSRGVGIFTAFHNGRRVVLHVERNPAFAATDIAMLRRQPAPGGYERIYACTHLGVQIQWSEFEPIPMPAAQPRLEVVRG